MDPADPVTQHINGHCEEQLILSFGTVVRLGSFLSVLFLLFPVSLLPNSVCGLSLSLISVKCPPRSLLSHRTSFIVQHREGLSEQQALHRLIHPQNVRVTGQGAGKSGCSVSSAPPLWSYYVAFCMSRGFPIY